MGFWNFQDEPDHRVKRLSLLSLAKEITMSFRIALRAFVPALLLALGVPQAHAGDLMTASTTVTYGDLDLAQPTGAKALAERLSDAAREVCVKANPTPLSSDQMRGCIDAAIALAMSRIENRLDGQV